MAVRTAGTLGENGFRKETDSLGEAYEKAGQGGFGDSEL